MLLYRMLYSYLNVCARKLFSVVTVLDKVFQIAYAAVVVKQIL